MRCVFFIQVSQTDRSPLTLQKLNRTAKSWWVQLGTKHARLLNCVASFAPRCTPPKVKINFCGANGGPVGAKTPWCELTGQGYG
jgi:hypothetical protein